MAKQYLVDSKIQIVGERGLYEEKRDAIQAEMREIDECVMEESDTQQVVRLPIAPFLDSRHAENSPHFSTPSNNSTLHRLDPCQHPL